MQFCGLFIGVDRYLDSNINWLSYAKRDAIAMHTLFSDTLGDGSVLLTDVAATKANLEAELQLLTSCSVDDVVVIYFSGHGSETHELVTFDADKYQLATTAISLDSLTDWFSGIPATRLVCILDCCFSGGMGAKVLKTDAKQRSLSSTEDILNQLSGNGRVVFTASGPPTGLAELLPFL